MQKRVLAVGAHPDDIEFMMAGTLFLLLKAGYEIHYMNIANGSCGSVEQDAGTIIKIRRQEAESACKRLSAIFHPPLINDIEIFYEKKLLASLCSIIRQIAPEILLVHSPHDYMEDHMNACRLAVTAAFCRSMPNFPVDPPHPHIQQEITIYHAQPYSNRDELGRVVKPDFYVNISEVIDEKAAMLAEHKSQKEWLDKSQGIDAYLNNMKQIAWELGEMSGKFKFAEGWRRHNTLGFCAPDVDPLSVALADYIA